MHFRPLHGRVVMRRIDAEVTSAGASSLQTPQWKSRSTARSLPGLELATRR